MKRLFLAVALACAPAYAQCPAGFVQLADTIYNPDGTLYSGSISYALNYDALAGGSSVRGNRITLSISSGVVAGCIAPGKYTVTQRPAYTLYPITTYWVVPACAGSTWSSLGSDTWSGLGSDTWSGLPVSCPGPLTIAQIEGSPPVTWNSLGSLTWNQIP